jgi:hypothetical protein
MGIKRKGHPDGQDTEGTSNHGTKRHETGEEDHKLPESPPRLPSEPPPHDPPPLPNEPLPDDAPPLPDEPTPPSSEEDEDEPLSTKDNRSPQPGTTEPDAWQAIWEPSAQAYYFYNIETKEKSWLNPRLPPDEAAAYLAANPPKQSQLPLAPEEPPEDVYDPETGEYGFTARFNLRTGKFQNNAEITAENFSTQGQLMRTAREYFDVKQMSEGKVVGQSGGALKAERKAMKVPKSAMKELIRRRKEKKDANKREWLINDDIIVRKH